MTQEKQHQIDIVANRIDDFGSVSRNWCLSQRITRLSAIILKLKQQGYDLKGEREGGDYVYRVRKYPARYSLKKDEIIQDQLFKTTALPN